MPFIAKEDQPMQIDMAEFWKNFDSQRQKMDDKLFERQPTVSSVHSVENLPIAPAGMPATEPDAPKMAVTGKQWQWQGDQAGSPRETLKKYWAFLVFLAGAILAADQTISPLLSSKVEPKTVEVAPKSPPRDDALLKKQAELEKNQADLLDVVSKQKKVIDTLMKKGT